MKTDTMNHLNYNKKLLDLSHYWSRMKPATRRRHVNEIAEEHGISTSLIYKKIKELRESGNRDIKNRIDKGKPKNLCEEYMRGYVGKIMGLKALNPYKPDHKIGNSNKAMSTARAIEILENTGEIPKGILTAKSANYWAKIYGIRVKDICAPRPAVKLVSLNPNHVHQVDCSVCDQYYPRDSDGKVMEKPFTYKNKPNEAREKIWLFLLVDHNSNVKFAKYYLSPGESSEIMIDGMTEAWSLKDDSQFPFHGVPKIVYGDKGSALMSQKVQNFLKALNVKVIEHKPGNPRAKGMVESGIGHIQRDFESELKLRPASSIEELNERIYNWTVEHNMKVKSGESRSRNSIWKKITQDQLFELPPVDILRKVTASNVIRTVDIYCNIRLNNEFYQVPEDLIRKKVRVWTNIDGEILVQDIETGKMHDTCEPRTAVFGTYNAHKKSAAERMQDDAIRMAGELEITRDVLRRETPNIHHLPKTGMAIEVESDLAREEETSYRNKFLAQIAITDVLGMNLSELPDWQLEKIDEALTITLDKERVRKIAEFIREFRRSEGAG